MLPCPTQDHLHPKKNSTIKKLHLCDVKLQSAHKIKQSLGVKMRRKKRLFKQPIEKEKSKKELKLD
jgi:hypothetical protein